MKLNGANAEVDSGDVKENHKVEDLDGIDTTGFIVMLSEEGVFSLVNSDSTLTDGAAYFDGMKELVVPADQTTAAKITDGLDTVVNQTYATYTYSITVTDPAGATTGATTSKACAKIGGKYYVQEDVVLTVSITLESDMDDSGKKDVITIAVSDVSNGEFTVATSPVEYGNTTFGTKPTNGTQTKTVTITAGATVDNKTHTVTITGAEANE